MNKKRSINRRSFMKKSALGIAGAGALGKIHLSSSDRESKQEFPGIKKYHKLGRIDFNASDIGIGTSRAFSVPIIKSLLDAGVNYIDTGERYGRGSAEKSIGEAIKGRNRKKLFITTKVSMRGVDSKEKVLKKVYACLERLQTDYVDCLMYHGTPTIEALNDKNFHAACRQLIKEGKVKSLGISNHGPRQPGEGESMEKVLVAAAQDGRFDVLLLVYNFIQKDQGEKILAACAKNNVAATIMKSNPLGRYFQTKERIQKMKNEGKEINERIQNYLARMEKTAKKGESFLKKHNLKDPSQIKEAAIKFVLNNPKVQVLNLAFNNFEDISTYLKLSGLAMNTSDKSTLAAYKRNCHQLYCRHACGICEAKCPGKVPVNTIMRYNHYFEASGNEKYAMEKYAGLTQSNAQNCRNCQGYCETACPYGIPIQGLLTLAHDQLTLA